MSLILLEFPSCHESEYAPLPCIFHGLMPLTSLTVQGKQAQLFDCFYIPDIKCRFVSPGMRCYLKCRNNVTSKMYGGYVYFTI